jgi:hypothetical protein
MSTYNTSVIPILYSKLKRQELNISEITTIKKGWTKEQFT